MLQVWKSTFIILAITGMVIHDVNLNPMQISINEVNISPPNPNQMNEFIELTSDLQSPITVKLDNYFIIVIRGENSDINGPTIETVIDLTGKTFKPGKKFFVIGSNTNADITTRDLKFQFYTKLARHQFHNFLMYAHEAPNGIALLYNVNGMPSTFKLTRRKHKLPITDTIKKKIKSNIVDFLIYGTHYTRSDKCGIFEALYPPFNLINYVLHDINTNNDMSINKCSLQAFSQFRPDLFKLGKLTPGLENDCESGISFIVKKRIDQCIAPKLPSYDVNTVYNTETDSDSCSADGPSKSKYRRMSKTETERCLKQNIDLESQSSCKNNFLSSQGQGDIIQHIRDLDKRKERYFEMAPEENEWESESHFDPNWLSLIKKHQKHILPVKTLTKNKKVRQWFVYYPNENDPKKSTYGCLTCSKYSEHFKIISGRYSSKLSLKGGVLDETYKRNVERILTHSNTKVHQLIVNELIKEKEMNLPDEFKLANRLQNEKSNDYYKVTASMMRLVYLEVKINIPLGSHKYLVQQNELAGAPMGYHHYDHITARKMALFISNHMLKIFLDQLKDDSSWTPISIICDGSTDAHQAHYFIVFFQTVIDNKSHIIFYRLLKLGSDETANGLLNTLVSSFQNDGIEAAVKRQLIGYASDGAAVMMGKKGGLGKLLEGYVNHKLVSVHCLAHRLHLAIRRGLHKRGLKYPKKFEDDINSLYTFYFGRGHMRLAKLREFATIDIMVMNYIFETRWISSELTAVHRVIHNLEELIKDLESIPSQPRIYNDKTRSTAVGLHNSIGTRNFVSLLYFMADVLNILAIYSKLMQESEGVISKQSDEVQNLVKNLQQLKTGNDLHIGYLLGNCTCDNISPCTMATYENANVVKYKSIILKENSRNQVYKKLTQIRSEVIDLLVTEIKSYIPEVEFQAYGMFNPESFPENIGDQQTYMNNELEKLSTVHSIPISSLKQEWLKFLEKVTTDDDWCQFKDSKVRNFWAHYLNKFDHSQLGDNLRNLTKQFLAIPIGSADAERGFSVLFHIRSSRRSKLSPGTLDAFMRLRLNGVKNLQHFPAIFYAKEWKKAGNVLTDDISGQRKKKIYEPMELQILAPEEVGEENHISLSETNLFP